jgi:ABC transport system ATP-binding/permease protein
MSETILNALVQLFALIADIHDETVITSREKNVLRAFLARHLNKELVARYMKLFEKYLLEYNSENLSKGSLKDLKRTSLKAMRILSICEKINEELQQKQKAYVLIQLMDYISLGAEITETELDFLQTVGNAFYIPEMEFHDIKSFVMNHSRNIVEKLKLLIVDNDNQSESGDVKHIYCDHLTGRIQFFYIGSTNTYILRYEGNEDIYLNGQNISADQTYVFNRGSTIRGSGIKTIYYSEISNQIFGTTHKFKISVDAQDVSFRFRNSETGIHNLNFHGESGTLIGILGGSGVGKSTTLSILSGTLKPQSGKVLINGYDLYDENEKGNLKGIIGLVPQDDLLIEELTVFQNIYYNAKMCLNNLPEEKLNEVIDRVLFDFDLEEIKDLKVGNPLKKVISGGQRKRVNIALELLREPTILFVDEPTSGLSSVDSEAVMNLLKEQTHKGKIVIINIHQPGSEIYKMFDKIMIIDKGGYPIYFGNPTEAIIYFKTISKHANPEEDQCIKCGNVDTDQILQIVEAKVINEHGKATRARKISPKEWADKFRERTEGIVQKVATVKQPLPKNNFSIPGLLKQSRIFFTRDLLSKLADKQYILISMLGSPILALLLAYFTRFSKGSGYFFGENENIPAYLFMCVITSLFLGLMGSSEEIVRDRKILKRESFLNLSWFSYLNSKVLILFIISAIQTILFIAIGNVILGIKGMTLSFWLVLFTTSCAANILGLNISSAFNSVVTIYIVIPFIIIPQLLFSGVLVKFDKLHLSSTSSQEYVPVIGDLMLARWSFEAMAVEQFKNNYFERPFFKNQVEESNDDYNGTILINSNLKKDLRICRDYIASAEYKELAGTSLSRINYHIDELAKLSKIFPGSWKESLQAGKFNRDDYIKAAVYFDSLQKYFMGRYKHEVSRDNMINDSLVSALGKEGRISLEENNKNIRLETLILNRESPDLTIVTPERIIRKYKPGYMKATSKLGRAHFYAPVKMIGNLEIDTYWFNISLVWGVSLLLYLALYFNFFRKIIDFFSTMRLQKSET